MPASGKQSRTRSVSATSSGDRTIRARRRSSATPVREDKDTATTDEEDDDDDLGPTPTDETNQDDAGASSTLQPGKPSHPAAMSAGEISDSIASSPRPPLLRNEASNREFNSEDDVDQGPSDYWRRPVLVGHGDGDGASTTDWKPSGVDRSFTPDADDDFVDSAEYSKRMEQVLALRDSPTPSPTSRRDRNRAALFGDVGDGNEPQISPRQHPNQERTLHRRLRGDEMGATMDELQGEEEFGALQSPLDVRHDLSCVLTSQDNTSDQTPSIASGSISGQERFRPLRSSPIGPSRSYIRECQSLSC